MTTATLNWVLPTVDVNNNPLPPAAITETLIFAAVNGAAATQIGVAQGDVTTFTTDTLAIVNDADTTYVFSIEAMDAAGTSQMSASVTVIVPAPQPGIPSPPTGLTVTLNS